MRARALPPAERRAALVDSARALILRRGSVPSTREIAEAAGIAEGTIFRVFDTKEDLVEAVIASTFCPATFRRGLDDIDGTLPLRPRLIAVVSLLQSRFRDVFAMMHALGLSAPPPSMSGDHERCSPDEGHVDSPVSKAGPTTHGSHGPGGHGHGGHGHDVEGKGDENARAAYLIERFITPDADRLRCSPGQLVAYLRLLTFSGSHPHITDGSILTPPEIVDVLLFGVLEPTAPTGCADHTAHTSQPTTRSRKAR
ncbi:MAG: TetR/AcrR family transcriptional regulator [Lapillicoccus sp.]